MRVVSLPQTTMQTTPVTAAERAGARDRERAPIPDAVAKKSNERGDMRPASTAIARTPRSYLQADAALVGVGLTAQNMYHSENAGPAEESIVLATKAYADIDNMWYRQSPFSYRVA